MRRLGSITLLMTTFLVVAAISILGTAATAGNPHQVQSCTVTTSGNTLTFTCKEAGLGDEDQVHIVFTATALCINPGGNHPKATNKASISASFDEPVQNGKADFTETITATFQPDCTPPMTVQFTDVSITDTTNGITLF